MGYSKKFIEDYYAKEYIKLVKFACNPKQGGDRLQLEKQDAEDLISDLMCFHLEKPASFSAKYIFNTILQRRKNFHRDKKREQKSLYQLRLKSVAEETCYEDEEEIPGEYRYRLQELIRALIITEEDLDKREALTLHFIKGIGTAEVERMVGNRVSRMFFTRFNERVEKLLKTHKDVTF